MGKTKTEAEIAERRRTHVGRLLFELSAHFERESLARLHARGHERLTQSQKQVLIHMPLNKGVRLTDLALRMGMTKQAAMKLVDALESIGYLRRESDQDDQRAKSVVVTQKGRKLVEDGLATVDELEAEYAKRIGESKLESLRAGMLRLSSALSIKMPDDSE